MSLSSARAPAEDITRDQLELLKAKFDVLQGERKVRAARTQPVAVNSAALAATARPRWVHELQVVHAKLRR